MNVFLDTNILMDVLLERAPFVSRAREIWFLAEQGKIKGLISALSFPNIYYIVRKLENNRKAMAMMKMMRQVFFAANLDEHVLNQAIDANFADFEDAIQYYSALRADAVCLVSRNKSHFPASGNLPVISPAEFLAAYSFE